jgi:HEAT repeat protein
MLKEMRPKTFTTLLVAALTLAACLFAASASAQRGGARSGNDNAPRGGDQPKHVFVGRGSDSQQGSRVTIKSDNPLNDYSAYRSGDRFYVVLPKAAAGSVARGGGGKGYSDMQVQQRGDSVVLSYRVQPGAKPRVEQKFNRLDIVFDVPEGGGQQAAANSQGDAARTNPPAENRNPNASGQQTNQSSASSSSQSATNVSERRPATTPDAAREQAASTAATANTAPTTAAIVPPAAGTGQGAQNGAQPSTAPTQEPATASTPAGEPQVAQAQPPTAIAPITNTQPAANSQATGTSLGTFLIRNWALALVFALVVVGLGLIFAARRTSSTHTPADDLASDKAGSTTLNESRTTRLATASTVATQPIVETKTATKIATKPEPEVKTKTEVKLDSVGESNLDATPLAAASLLATGAAVGKSRKKSRMEARQEAKRKKKGARPDEVVRDDKTAAADDSFTESAADKPFAEPVAEEASALEPVNEVTESPAAEAFEPSDIAATAELIPATTEAAPTTEATSTETIEAAFDETETIEAAPVEAAAVEEMPAAIVEEVPDEAVAVEETAAEAAVGVKAVEAAASEASVGSPVTEIEPAFAPDSETVQAETRHLLEGEGYDRAVVGSHDPMARQMIAAELLSALAGRNTARRARAGAAFVEQGYYDETVRDLRSADAPAERAAAARSLALLADRSATSHLVVALEDSSMDVRRAAVEALGTLRDPSAVAPLEALLEREKKERNRIPGRVIRNAVESCREGFAEVHAEAPAAAPSVETHEPAAVVEPTPTVEDAQAIEVAAEPEAVAAVAVEETPSESVEASQVSLTPFVEEPVVESAADVAPREEERAVVETGLQPFGEVEEATVEVAKQGIAEVAEEVGIEPFGQLTDEAAAPQVREPFASVAETAQPALFDDAAAEATREIEPTQDAYADKQTAAVDEVAHGEWFDFDMSELHGKGQTAATGEPVAEPSSAHTSVFESSSGETISAPVVAEAEAVAEEPSPHVMETARDLEVVSADEPSPSPVMQAPAEQERAPVSDVREKGLAPIDEFSTVPASLQHRLASHEPSERAAAVVELSHVDTDEAFQHICSAFDDESKDVRGAAARALFELRTDRAESFTRALREATPERRREIGAAISSSGLAAESISQLTGESREKTYEAFSLLFLMAKAGEVQPLVRAIEGHPNNEVRLAVVKLLALSGQKEILPAFRRLAVRGSLPTEVRSAVMEAIYQISSSQPSAA